MIRCGPLVMGLTGFTFHISALEVFTIQIFVIIDINVELIAGERVVIIKWTYQAIVIFFYITSWSTLNLSSSWSLQTLCNMLLLKFALHQFGNKFCLRLWRVKHYG